MVRAAVSELWFEVEMPADSRPRRILRIIRDLFARFLNVGRCATCAVEMVDGPDLMATE